MTKRILFIVEGQRTEERFIRKMMREFSLTEERETYVYGTNIHVLYESVFGKDDPEDTDLLLALKSQTESKEEKRILSESYSDVLLVFDAEFQDPKFNPEHLRAMLAHFSDSTVYGKLYLNYPMMESYRHMPSLDWKEFLDYTVKRSNVPHYKRIVGEEGCVELRNPNEYDKRLMSAVSMANARKYLHLVNEDPEDIDSYDQCDGLSLFEIQMKSMNDRDVVYVMNTASLIIVDWNPSAFFTGELCIP